MNPLSIGIEIGGTKIQVGVSSPEGKLLHVTRRKAAMEAGAAGIRAALLAMTDEALRAVHYRLAEIARIGIGFGGLVDARRGVSIRSFQVDGWENFPLRDWAEEQWRRPAVIENDACTAGLAECVHGGGRGCERVFYITVGSGVGGGWIVQGRVDASQGIGSAEIGHTWMPDPQTGELAELEQICSGWAIGRRARAAASQTPATRMIELAGAVEAIEAPVVYAAAQQGDPLAKRLLAETCQALGLAIGNVITLLRPERVVIGGGVSLMGDLFWQGLREQVALRAFPYFGAGVEIVPAELGEEVVVIGALCLA